MEYSGIWKKILNIRLQMSLFGSSDVFVTSNDLSQKKKIKNSDEISCS